MFLNLNTIVFCEVRLENSVLPFLSWFNLIFETIEIFIIHNIDMCENICVKTLYGNE